MHEVICLDQSIRSAYLAFAPLALSCICIDYCLICIDDSNCSDLVNCCKAIQNFIELKSAGGRKYDDVESARMFLSFLDSPALQPITYTLK